MKKNVDISLFTVCLAGIGIWTIIPQFQVDTIYRIIVFGCFAGAVFYSFSRGSANISGDTLTAILFCVLFLCIDMVNGGLNKVLLNFTTYFFLLLVMIFAYMRDSDDFLGFEKFYFFAMILYTIVNLVTLISMKTDNSIIRTMVLDVEGSKQILRRGIGGFGLVFSQTVVLWCSLFLLIYGKYSRSKKVILLLHVASSALLIINAQFFIALISLVVGTIVMFLNINYRTRYIKYFFFIIIAFIFILNIQAILLYLYDLSSGTVYQEKIRDFLVILDGNSLQGDTAARANVYRESFEAFSKSPLLGNLFTGNLSGGHSTILDALSQYGIFLGIPYLILMFRPLRDRNSYNYKRERKIRCFRNTVLSSALVSLVLDPMGYHYWFAWFIFFPIANRMLLKARMEE